MSIQGQELTLLARVEQLEEAFKAHVVRHYGAFPEAEQLSFTKYSSDELRLYAVEARIEELRKEANDIHERMRRK